MSVETDHESMYSSDSITECTTDKDDEELDPRVQIELEKLNDATTAINKAESELEKARASTHRTLSEMTAKLNNLAKKFGKHIKKARLYYELRIQVENTYAKLKPAALAWEVAGIALKESKLKLCQTEESLIQKGGNLDVAWQAMLNHATQTVTQGEQELAFRESQFIKLDREHREAEKNAARKINSSAIKTIPYYELCIKINQFFEIERLKQRDIELFVAQAKTAYSEALLSLESISAEIHQQRIFKKKIMAERQRTAGLQIRDLHDQDDYYLDIQKVEELLDIGWLSTNDIMVWFKTSNPPS